MPNLTFNCELTKLQDENNALKQRLHDVEDPYYSLQWGGGGVGEQGGQSLPLPVPRSPASRTFVPLYLPTPALHCVAPVFRLIKRIRDLGLTFKLCRNLTFFFIFWPLFWQGDRWFLMKVTTGQFS